MMGKTVSISLSTALGHINAKLSDQREKLACMLLEPYTGKVECNLLNTLYCEKATKVLNQGNFTTTICALCIIPVDGVPTSKLPKSGYP